LSLNCKLTVEDAHFSNSVGKKDSIFFHFKLSIKTQ